VQFFEISCKTPSLIGEQITCDLLVSSNQTSLSFSLDFGDGTTQAYTFSSNYFLKLSFFFHLIKICFKDLGIAYYGAPIPSLNLDATNSVTLSRDYFLVTNEITEDCLITGFEFYAVRNGSISMHVYIYSTFSFKRIFA
jgi:hypothetical protein